ncbi:uncharacterized protein FIBRA_02193 [Fibroporia radiculosa]|uniref:Methyltransferase type 12 domain-containing protein n=1 Tax=Fibroporia radiculosa TaxID=599839 RepID=J4GML6_9APHY|nr:uncharacterized protein FIBRA_02193 [Fibroporia radiculosa]CCM00165.1 predicted protein [Fibroporia radiculosa]
MDPSARVYSSFKLYFYDFVVLVVSNALAWRCSTRAVLLPFFQAHIGERTHLDIGVGTGYYPAHSILKLARTTHVTLFDLNPATLHSAEQRLRTAGYNGVIEKVERSIFLPLPESLQAKFDSISLFYVFHCLPGSFPEKAISVFTVAAAGLAPGGVLYGATILGQGVHHNWFGRQLMAFYNKKGIFGNTKDSAENLELALKECFEDVKIRVVGMAALFEARGPISK